MIEGHSDEIDASHNFHDNENDNEEFIRVLDELEGKKRQCLNEQQRVTELEEQLHVISKWIFFCVFSILSLGVKFSKARFAALLTNYSAI